MSLLLNLKAEGGSVVDPLSEADSVHRNRYQGAAGKVACGSHPGNFIDPLKHNAAKQVAMVVEVLGSNQGKVFHVFNFLFRTCLPQIVLLHGRMSGPAGQLRYGRNRVLPLESSVH